MRILALTNLYPNPLQPGRGPYNRLIFRGLAERVPLRVVAPIAWTDYVAAWWKKKSEIRNPKSEIGQPLVAHPLYYFPPRCFRAWYGHCFYASVRKTMDRVASEFKPDLLYASWAYPDGWAAVEYGARRGLPVVVSVLGSDVLMVPPHTRRHRRTLDGLRRAAAVVTVSRDLADKVVPFGVAPERVHVICTGVDPHVFHYEPPAAARTRLGLDPTEPVILAIGNLVPVKGFDVLVDACAILAGGGERFQCYLLGEGPQRKRLEAQIGARGLTGRFHLLGARPQEQLPDWYRAANVVAISSRSEGVPNVQLEAIACGTPYVATRVGGIPEFAHRGRGQLVPPGDSTQLAAALRRAIHDRQPRTAPDASEPRFLDEVVSDLLSLFETVSGERGCVSAPSEMSSVEERSC